MSEVLDQLSLYMQQSATTTQVGQIGVAAEAAALPVSPVPILTVTVLRRGGSLRKMLDDMALKCDNGRRHAIFLLNHVLENANQR